MITLTPAAVMLLQLAVESAIRMITAELKDMTPEEMDIRIAELMKKKDEAIAELESH